MKAKNKPSSMSRDAWLGEYLLSSSSFTSPPGETGKKSLVHGMTLHSDFPYDKAEQRRIGLFYLQMAHWQASGCERANERTEGER